MHLGLCFAKCSVHPHLGQTPHYPFVFIDNYSGSRSMPPAATSEQNQLPGRPQAPPLPHTKRLAPSPCMVGAGIPTPQAGCPVWGTGNAPALGATLVTKFIDE